LTKKEENQLLVFERTICGPKIENDVYREREKKKGIKQGVEGKKGRNWEKGKRNGRKERLKEEIGKRGGKARRKKKIKKEKRRNKKERWKKEEKNKKEKGKRKEKRKKEKKRKLTHTNNQFRGGL
jgi:hypothetical protein